MDGISSNNFVGTSALQNAVQGLQKSEAKVSAAALDVVEGFAKAANFVSDKTGGLNALADAAPVGGKGIIAPMIDMKVGAAAYSANLATLKVAGEMQESLMDIVA
jgi:hypothetical protein